MAQFPVALSVMYRTSAASATRSAPAGSLASTIMTSARRSPAVQDYWQEFCRSRSIPADQRYDVFAFGDTPALADELLALVLAGPKRATAALVAQFERSGDPLPEAGLHSVVLNGRGEPG